MSVFHSNAFQKRVAYSRPSLNVYITKARLRLELELD
jgi:hypothetical protein